ncbi:DUF1275 domain-containing protein [bacterium]|nr:DUF1275 domain-containing protein [bacterium]
MKRLFHIVEDRRTPGLNQALGIVTAFISGAVNAGGFLAVGQYTSHITGVVSGIADYLGLGRYSGVTAGIVFVGTFWLGAVISTVMISLARRSRLHSQFAVSYILAGMALVFAGSAAQFPFQIGFSGQNIKCVLFAVMGALNATVTHLTNYDIRSTHMTGIVTDLGIEFGKLVSVPHEVNWEKFRLIGLIFASFVMGGILGAFMVGRWLGLDGLVVLGCILMLCSLTPLVRDARVRLRYIRRHRNKTAD